ncbi:flavin reductase like protein [Variovorax beijingensis]|uniref:Flavin reductase (DIM6/NTAB) family NADH-FMN oxidoreductase RutF n=2 Tax=Variovorax TaxID=34072 RepID=A0AAE3Y3D4_VARPD|nr:flavin reductase (DIM6/NTAB) family NADH-FMN oxidoreductase RutF [Variovorax paradoxus]MDR6428775.1 flavin reductase (DIM6/NTAB) family NADH-FMN oxidoreductase RutF [Variovorax paradoxus]MDR6455899.1 flavin reductase (DIM6/NTAB) family NADH-FMN oxidoreductase RutF [Variovorax paradoxus]TWD75944.1 flavin reductase like protein [Variovorax beijingensis]
MPDTCASRGQGGDGLADGGREAAREHAVVIGWISTRSAVGHINLAPYSFFNVFNYKPPIVAFSSVGWKDTICNVRDSGEFVVNLATRALAEQLNLSCAELASTEDELGFTGLDTLASQYVAAPRVRQGPRVSGVQADALAA